VLTQTRPCPPPAAGVALATASGAAAPAVLVEVLAGAAGDGLVEVFGLKKSASVFFFSGEPAGLAAGEALAVDLGFFPCFSAGEGDAAASVVDDGEVAAVAFALWLRLVAAGDASASAAGEAAGDSVVAALADGDASFFVECLCFATVADASGLGAGVGV